MSFRHGGLLIASFLFLFTSNIQAQRAGLEVTRTTAIDRSQPVINVTVDGNGRKWASNRSGVVQVKASDFGSPHSILVGERNVLSYRGGNADISWSDADFKRIVETPCSVTAAWWDAKAEDLWLGTDEAGIFRCKVKPEFKLVQQYTTANSKLKSNEITIIYQDKTGRLWVGTDNGLMSGTPGRWKSDLSGYPIERIREYGTVIYVLADGDISKAPNGEKWSDLDINPGKIEGQIADFDVDVTGKMWMVSGVLTRLDLIENTYEVFSGPELYTSQYGSCLAIDPEGAVWVGTEDKGLFLVDKASNMTVNINLDEGVSCDGNGKDAALSVKVTGGTPPYTYTWENGLTGATPRNVPFGNHNLTVTDSKGKTRGASVQVPDTRLKVTVRQKKNASGPGRADAAAEIDIDGNASGIIVAWDNGENLVTANRLAPGMHQVTITNQKGCSTVAKIDILEKPAPLSASISEASKIKCFGERGALAVQPTGGKAPFKYQWNKPELSGEKPINVASGDYIVTVTDANGATATASYSLRQPAEFTLSVEVQGAANTGQNNGKAIAFAKGGTGTFVYKWDNGETLPSASKLTPGKHSMSVTDANGCVMLGIFEIKENIAALSVAISETSTIKCHGERSNLKTQVFGGKSPFKYEWNGLTPGTTPTGDVNNYTVPPGIYSLTVTDAVGTTATTSITVRQPDVLSATAQATAQAGISAADGKATVTAVGGTMPYTYVWDNGEAVNTAVRLASGKHTVSITDANGCATTAQVNITENILPLSVQITEKTPAKCSGQMATLNVSVAGGKSPFKYIWDKPMGGASKGEETTVSAAAGNYNLTVTDAVGSTASANIVVRQPDPLAASALVTTSASIGGSDGQATASVSGGVAPFAFFWDNNETAGAATRLSAGKHMVTVTDANGCSATTSVTVTENILPLSVSIVEKAPIKCAGQQATLLAKTAGGKGPFRFNWNKPVNNLPESDGNVAVSAGDYSLTVTDAVGSTATASIAVKSPAPLSAAAAVDASASANGSDGKATATPTGGVAPYAFKWNSGETGASAIKLPAGKHDVIVTDINGCSATASVEITENILALTVNIVEKTKIRCAGDKAEIGVQVRGGKSPFTYNWNQPSLAGDKVVGMNSGDYVVTVTDAKGSTATASIQVVAPEPLVVELATSIGVSTDAAADGKARINIKGGASPYNILWDNKQTTQAANKLPLGKHSVTVKDAAGCAQTVDFETKRRAMPEFTRAIENGQTIQMRLLNFDVDSTSLKPSMIPLLDELYDFMVENPRVVIEVGGHTNNLPTDDFADKLSTNRAKTVAEYLTGKGVDAARVQYKGYGKRMPVAPNTSPEGRKANQRVEIRILKS